MTGKQKCRILKQIRRQIAEANDIRFLIEECTHKGKCRGTCPKCEWEVRVLERELEKRRLAGKKVALAGISAGFLLSSCSPIDTIQDFVSSVAQPLEGDMLAETTSGAVVEETMTPGETVAETVEGKLVAEPLEGEPAIPETEVELGEAEPVEEAAADGLLPPIDETEETEFDGAPLPEEETCEITAEEETEEEIWEVAGGMGPPDFVEEETLLEEEEYAILEGDVAYIEPAEGDLQ